VPDGLIPGSNAPIPPSEESNWRELFLTYWIAVGAIVLLGLALLKGVQATRGKDPS
jgi:hypothetical protein